MRITLLIAIPLLLVSALLSACQKDNAQFKVEPNLVDSTSEICLELKSIKNKTGNIIMALYNSANTFNKPDKVFRSYSFPVTADTLYALIDSIPPGIYAFGIINDENNNYTLDKNAFGVPKEGFAFSNNALGTFGPPDFEDAKFILPVKTKITQYIYLNFY